MTETRTQHPTHMDQLPNERDPRKGDEFVHPTGVREVVYAVVDGEILTFRQYPDVTAFERHNGEVSFFGIAEDVADLPSPLDICRDHLDADPDLFVADDEEADDV